MSELPTPHLVIPSALLPSDGRFGAGPSKVRDAQVDALVRHARSTLGTSHRQAPVKALVAEITAGLRDLFSLPEGYEIAIGNGGATMFWDVATTCLVRNRALHAVFGEFGAKFAAATQSAPFLNDSIIRSAPSGDVVLLDPTEGVDIYAWTHQETSTGAAVPVVRPATLDDALTIIDGTSAAGALPIDITQTDAYYFAPQKVFGSDAGLWIAILSPAAVDRAARLERDKPGGRWVPESLSLSTALENTRLNQTLNTPAIATLVMLVEQIAWLRTQGGLAWAVAKSAANADHLYRWAESRPWATPFIRERAYRSPVVATIDLAPNIAAPQVIHQLRLNGILDVFPYRKLGRNQLRIALFPAIDLSDVQRLTDCIDWVVQELAAHQPSSSQ